MAIIACPLELGAQFIMLGPRKISSTTLVTMGHNCVMVAHYSRKYTLRRKVYPLYPSCLATRICAMNKQLPLASPVAPATEPSLFAG
jgi:hypothetical protein